DEGKAFEKSYNLTSSSYNINIPTWSITEQTKIYEEWFTTRKEWMSDTINDLYPMTMDSLQKASKTYNIYFSRPFNEDDNEINNVYDILGKKSTALKKGIKIINGGKCIIRQ
ncbi:MAG: hypothetical protein U0K71_14935, partial [Paludibacteraceae bacterium]|nr:hypothetical protein [Paludibacteraceae bacterium]